MAGSTPKERFDAGFKIGTLSAPTRPLQSTDLIFVQDVSEAAALESVRVATVGDLFADMSGGTTGLTKSITINTAAEGMIKINFVNGILVSYASANGTGTIDDPYLVSTATQLDNVRNDLGAYYKQTANIALTDYQAGEGWVPIGHESDEPFTGVFDGAGYKITGLVSAPATGVAGLFGYLDGATITDLEIEDGDVASSADSVAGMLAASGSGTLSRIAVSGTVEGAVAGGLVGYFVGAITDCGADVAVNGLSALSTVGGLIGYFDFDGSITESYALGNVTGVASTAGGLVGTVLGDTAILDCYSTGAVSATADNSGGIAGWTFGDMATIVNCYSAGAITNGTVMGGIVGDSQDGLDPPSFVTCVWDNTVNPTLDDPSFGADGYTTTDMRKAATYTALGWDFTDIWAIVENTSYPTLQWQT